MANERNQSPGLALFFYRARRIFFIWAREYIRAAHRIELELGDVARIAEAVERAFLRTLRRRPSVREWAGFVVGLRTSKDPQMVTRYVEAFLAASKERPAPVDTYWRIFNASGRQQQIALWEFSVACAVSFTRLHTRNETFDIDVFSRHRVDWTEEDEIRAYVAKITTAKESWWRRAWKHFLTH